MGTWGPGNFDSDDAVDYVSKVVGGFVDTVEQLFAQGRASLDDQGEGRLMPAVEMIGVLCDWCQGGPPAIRVVAPPDPGVVRRWRQRYLEIYDEEIDGLLLPGKEHFGPERRAHIVRTFDRLELLAADFWEERPVTPKLGGSPPVARLRSIDMCVSAHSVRIERSGRITHGLQLPAL